MDSKNIFEALQVAAEKKRADPLDHVDPLKTIVVSNKGWSGYPMWNLSKEQARVLLRSMKKRESFLHSLH